jgi:hypothetical protein
MLCMHSKMRSPSVALAVEDREAFKKGDSDADA